MKSDASALPLWAWPLLAVILVAQATWIYRDASKRGEKKFLWGFFGLLNFPSSILVYLVVTRTMARKAECPACHRRIPADSVYCPHCGAKREA